MKRGIRDELNVDVFRFLSAEILCVVLLRTRPRTCELDKRQLN